MEVDLRRAALILVGILTKHCALLVCGTEVAQRIWTECSVLMHRSDGKVASNLRSYA